MPPQRAQQEDLCQLHRCLRYGQSLVWKASSQTENCQLVRMLRVEYSSPSRKNADPSSVCLTDQQVGVPDWFPKKSSGYRAREYVLPYHVVHEGNKDGIV